MKICSCFGHREIENTPKLHQRILNAYCKLIAQGYNVFLFGGFGDFDYLCWEIVSDLKKEHPNIQRIYCLSDPRHERPLKRPKYLKREDFEQFIYLDMKFDWWYQRIYFRNCEMIDRSSAILFYVNHSQKSGAYKAYQYATKKKDKLIVNLCFEEL